MVASPDTLIAMRGRVGILSILVLLLLVGTILYAPVRWRISAGYVPPRGISTAGDYIEDPVSPDLRYRWTWERERRYDSSRYPPVPMIHEAINWPLVVAEQSIILLVGGALLTWVVRRERRRRVGAGA